MSGDLSEDEGFPQLNLGCVACLVETSVDDLPLCFPEGSAHRHLFHNTRTMQPGKSKYQLSQ